jgi:hypothetical protein
MLPAGIRIKSVNLCDIKLGLDNVDDDIPTHLYITIFSRDPPNFIIDLLLRV